jgi:chromosome partitioning protein
MPRIVSTGRGTRRVITIAAPKGGSGKTTLASALAVRADEESRAVVMVDLNADQGNLTQWWIARGEPDSPTLVNDISDANTIVEAVTEMRRNGWQWRFIDTPPCDLDLIETAILIADVVLIPVRTSIFDIGAIDPVMEICRQHRKPFAFVLSAVDVKFRGLTATAVATLSKQGRVLDAGTSYGLAYINAVTIGKSGPEIDPDLRPEIDALWAQVKRLAGVALQARGRGRVANV